LKGHGGVPSGPRAAWELQICWALGACQTTRFSDLMNELPPRERRQFEPEVESLAGVVATKIQELESL